MPASGTSILSPKRGYVEGGHSPLLAKQPTEKLLEALYADGAPNGLMRHSADLFCIASLTQEGDILGLSTEGRALRATLVAR